MSRFNKQIYTYSPSEIIKQLAANAKPMTIDRKKGNPSNPTPCTYMSVNFDAVPLGETRKTKASAIIMLQESDEPITIISGMHDPSDNTDYRTKGGYGPTLESSLAYGGIVGKMLDELDPIWIARIQEMTDLKEIITKGRALSPLIKRVNSDEECVPEEYRGAEKKDPAFRIKLDFGVWPATYFRESMRGSVKTQIFDYTKKFINPKTNKVEYEPATVDGALIDATNAHKFILPGSKIRRGRFFMDSASVSKFYTSLAVLGTILVIEPNAGEGFSDDKLEHTEEIAEAFGEPVDDLVAEL